MLIDTHTHLNFRAFEEDWREVVERAVQAGVEKMIVVGTDVESSRRAVEMAEAHEALYVAVGIHPHHCRGIQDLSLEIEEPIDQIRELIAHEKVVAVGEIGLDYHLYKNTQYEIKDTEDEWVTIKTLQRELFLKQLTLAAEQKKPVIVHSREAGTEVLDMIAKIQSSRELKGVFHCFEGSKKYTQQILEAELYISFTGNVTYAFDRAEVAKEVPLNRLLLETDCPYMAPEPHRRERNEPSYVKIVAKHHAKSRGIQLDELVEQTSINAYQLFGI